MGDVFFVSNPTVSRDMGGAIVWVLVVSRKVCRQPADLLFFIPAVSIATLGNPKALFLYDKINSIV